MTLIEELTRQEVERAKTREAEQATDVLRAWYEDSLSLSDSTCAMIIAAQAEAVLPGTPSFGLGDIARYNRYRSLIDVWEQMGARMQKAARACGGKLGESCLETLVRFAEANAPNAEPTPAERKSSTLARALRVHTAGGNWMSR